MQTDKLAIATMSNPLIPLQGKRILELAKRDERNPAAVAIAFAGRLAAGFGASVVSCEIDPCEDVPGSHVTPCVSDTSASWPAPLSEFLGAGKQVVDFRGDPEAFLRSVQSADAILVDACRLEELDAEMRRRLQAVPHVVVENSSSDDSGLRRGYTLMAQTGILDLVGEKGGEPLPLPGHQPAYTAGLAAYLALASELIIRKERNQDDAGQRIDVSVLDCLLWVNWKSLLADAWGLEPPSRNGREAGWPILSCADGWVALVYREGDWDKLRALIGDSRLNAKEFETEASRQKNRLALHNVIEEGLCRFSRAELVTQCLQLKLPLGPVWTKSELVHDPQYRERNVFEDGEGRKVRLPVRINGSAVGRLASLESCGENS